jgi:hypothetical protein
MDAADFKIIEEMFKHHLVIMSEEIHRKLDAVIEWNRIIGEKLDRMAS